MHEGENLRTGRERVGGTGQMYIGHKREDGEIQALRDHLLGVAVRARGFAEKFGAGDHAYRTGLLHDIGKYAPDVQRRMADPEHVDRVNHTSAGAIAAQQMMDLYAAFAIAGHHGGLSDLGARTSLPSEGTLWGKLKYKPQDCSAYRREIEPDLSAEPPAWIGQDALAGSFYTRMLFSCLVDADFLDTEAFMRGDALRREGGDSMRALLGKLDAYVAPWFPATSEINARRCAILKRCREMGAGPKGLYTLTVPTGGGKTVSSLAFALRHAAEHGCARVIYVVPYMSIIEQNAAKFAQILGEENVLEHHSGVEYDEDDLDDTAALRAMQKRLATENWDAPVVVTTAVQFFESLYAASTSRCRKLHSIANSVIVLDEAQMLPLDYLMPCVYAIAELVRHYNATAVLCTATQPALDGLFRQCAPELRITEIMEQPQALYEFFRRVTFRQEGELDGGALAQQIAKERQALCIVNTKKRAQDVFDSLPEDGRFHLSTLMTPNDRSEVIRTIRARLAAGQVCRVVSTSLIEAGVDVDFPSVWREKAGLDSILQAAGRCNREGSRGRTESVVHIFTTGDRPPRQFVKPLQATDYALQEENALDSLRAIELYSRCLIQQKGEFIDSREILKSCENFNFRKAADDFRLIDADTVPVYIPTAHNEALLQALRKGDFTAKTVRRLQKDSVNVYRDQAQRLLGAGKVQQTEDGFLILADAGSYDPERGLCLCDAPGMDIFI